jgi:uncharacterized protein YjbI with pentapeptide repeats
MKFEIKNRWNGSIIFSLETESLKLCVEAAVKSGAYLDCAYLDGANLDGANLDGAYLDSAYLDGAKYGDGVPLETEPLQLLGGRYQIFVFDTHIKIGCKLFKHSEWENFTDKEIAKMDYGALEWWNEWRGLVLSLSLGHQQRIAANNEKK